LRGGTRPGTISLVRLGSSFTALVSLLARLRLPGGFLAESSNSRTELQLRSRRYSFAALLPRRPPETRPTPPPFPRPASPAGLRAVPARSFLVEIRLGVRIRDNPLPPALGKVTAPRSYTT